MWSWQSLHRVNGTRRDRSCDYRRGKKREERAKAVMRRQKKENIETHTRGNLRERAGATEVLETH